MEPATGERVLEGGNVIIHCDINYYYGNQASATVVCNSAINGTNSTNYFPSSCRSELFRLVCRGDLRAWILEQVGCWNFPHWQCFDQFRARQIIIFWQLSAVTFNRCEDKHKQDLDQGRF